MTPEPALRAGTLEAGRAARGTAFALGATVIEKGGGMLILLFLARTLGAERFGRYAALMSLVALFQVAAEFGLEPVLVRLLAQGRDTEATLVTTTLWLRVALGIAAGVLLVTVGGLVLAGLGGPVLVIAAGGILAGSGFVLRAVFRTHQRLEWLIVTALANVGVFAAVVIALEAMGLGVAGAVAAWAAGQLAATIAAVVLVRARISSRPLWDGGAARLLAGAGWALAANTLLLTVTLRIGTVIVLRLEGERSVALLAAGARLAEAFALIPEAMMLALLPLLARASGGAEPEAEPSGGDMEDVRGRAARAAAHGDTQSSGSDIVGRSRAAQRALSVRAVRYLALLALPVIITLSIAAPDLLTFLFGGEYAGGAPALRILAWLALLAASGSVFTNLLIARGHERLLLVLNGVASALTIGASLVAVRAIGFTGAAVATLAASTMVQGILFLLPATRDDVAACLRPLRLPVLLAIAFACAGMVVPGPSVPLACGAVVGFATTLVLTGTVDRQDWTLLRRLFAHP